MNKKLCISTVVDAEYQYFMPLFVYCLKNQYPEYEVKIFANCELAYNVHMAMNLIPQEYPFIVITDYFDKWVQHQYSPIAWRFCIDKEEYKDFDYIYVTDIDMMILREKVELLHFHLNEMAETGLDYSNSIRNKKHWKGQNSVSGLHFANYDFYVKTNEVMKKYAKQLKAGEVGRKREYDGNMLYRIIKESHLKMCKKYPLVERHHGIHLGNWRIFHRKSKLRSRMDPDKCRKWWKLWKDDTFRQIYELCSESPIVKQQITMLNEYCKKVI